jgi:hypothetical protein
MSKQTAETPTRVQTKIIVTGLNSIDELDTLGELEQREYKEKKQAKQQV